MNLTELSHVQGRPWDDIDVSDRCVLEDSTDESQH